MLCSILPRGPAYATDSVPKLVLLGRLATTALLSVLHMLGLQYHSWSSTADGCCVNDGKIYSLHGSTLGSICKSIGQLLIDHLDS
jgi:hypothetical protein